MATQTKTILKGYFNNGDIPTESNFIDLIDSFVQTSDGIFSGSLTSTVNGSYQTAGTGAQGLGDVMKYNVLSLNGEKVTTLIVDLQGLSSSAEDTAIIGTSGSQSYLFKWDEAINGVHYMTQIGCAETPTGGTSDIDVKHTSSLSTTYATIIGSQSISTATTLNAGETVNTHGQTLIQPEDGNYMYLTNGTTGTNGTYTAGKLIVKFYGV